MLALLLLAAVGVLFVHVARRVREDQAHESVEGRPGGDLSRPADRLPSIDWNLLITPRRKKMGLRFSVAAVLGCAAVVGGGILFGLWGLTAGTLVLAAQLAWAASLWGGFRLRRLPSDGSLTEKERRDFDEIVARLTADD